MNEKTPGQPQQPASQKDEDAVAFARGVFELARNGGAGPLSVMLSAGVPVNMRTSEGDSLLMLASGSGHLETVRLLLENGADPKAHNDQGETPSSLATSDTIRSLISEWSQ